MRIHPRRISKAGEIEFPSERDSKHQFLNRFNLVDRQTPFKIAKGSFGIEVFDVDPEVRSLQ